jgi:antagonist of KipI
MKTIEVVDGGLHTSVQDLGRFGYQRYGVPTSGGLDLLSLRAANRLVGNDDGAACLEMTAIGPRLRFLAPATIALTGADLGARVDDGPVSRWETFTVATGTVLSFGGPADGIRGYLAVAGGIDVPVVLGSRSTYARSRLGGIEGRPLRKGDVVHVTGARPSLLGGQRELPSALRWVYGHDHLLRVVLGPQDDRFTAEGVSTFLSATYTVTPQSDRMGYRLAGAAIAHTRGPDIVSDGTPCGAVQVAGDGVPIVLLSDRGTAGGYTKIAVVISADLPRVAQASPGDRIRFAAVPVAEAQTILREQEQWLDRIGVAATTRQHDTLRKVAAAVASVARTLAEG